MRFALLVFFLPAVALARGNHEAEKLFRRMEERIKAAQSFQSTADLEIKDARLGKMKLSIQQGDSKKSRYVVVGTANGKEFKIEAICHAEKLHLLEAGLGKLENWAAPKHLNEFMKVALARAGFVGVPRIVYSKRTLKKIEDMTPEQLIRVGKFQTEPDAKVRDRAAKAIKYWLEVEGEKSSYWVTLWLDAQTELPLKRIIASEKGTIVVEEEIHELTLDAKIDPKVFELPKK